MHGRRKETEVKKAAENLLNQSVGQTLKPAGSQAQPKEYKRQAEIKLSETVEIVADDVTVGLMREKKASNDKEVNEAKINKQKASIARIDTLLWMSCSGTEQQRKTYLMLVLPTILELSPDLKEILADKNNAVVIDKINFRKKDNTLLSPIVSLHVQHADKRVSHYQCKCSGHDVETRNVSVSPAKQDSPQKSAKK